MPRAEVPTSVSPIAAPGVRFTERWLEVEDGVELRLLSWRPEAGAVGPPVVFVAGWVSMVEGWAPVLEVLVRRQAVYYLETREKVSARIAATKLAVPTFAISRLAHDLQVLCAGLVEPPEEVILFGSSMGSNAILEALKHSRLGCRAAFVIGPNAEFAAPWWGRLLTRLPATLYHVVKGPVLWYLRHHRVNAREDPGQMARYERTLGAADPLRLKLSARAVLDYSVWPDLETVTAPVAFAFAPGDTLHDPEPIRRMARIIPRGCTVECESNTAMHTAAVVARIDDFLTREGR